MSRKFHTNIHIIDIIAKIEELDDEVRELTTKAKNISKNLASLNQDLEFLSKNTLQSYNVINQENADKIVLYYMDIVINELNIDIIKNLREKERIKKHIDIRYAFFNAVNKYIKSSYQIAFTVEKFINNDNFTENIKIDRHTVFYSIDNHQYRIKNNVYYAALFHKLNEYNWEE